MGSPGQLGHLTLVPSASSLTTAKLLSPRNPQFNSLPTFPIPFVFTHTPLYNSLSPPSLSPFGALYPAGFRLSPCTHPHFFFLDSIVFFISPSPSFCPSGILGACPSVALSGPSAPSATPPSVRTMPAAGESPSLGVQLLLSASQPWLPTCFPSLTSVHLSCHPAGPNIL